MSRLLHAIIRAFICFCSIFLGASNILGRYIENNLRSVRCSNRTSVIHRNEKRTFSNTVAIKRSENVWNSFRFSIETSAIDSARFGPFFIALRALDISQNVLPSSNRYFRNNQPIFVPYKHCRITATVRSSPNGDRLSYFADVGQVKCLCY